MNLQAGVGFGLTLWDSISCFGIGFALAEICRQCNPWLNVLNSSDLVMKAPWPEWTTLCSTVKTAGTPKALSLGFRV